MGQVGVLFPGQGSQVVGMCGDVVEAYPEAAAIFERADQILGFGLSQVCFGGPAERLNATDVAQPAIFVCSVALLEAMGATGHFEGVRPGFGAGLSSGEYTALYWAGVFDFESALRLVRRRGEAMQSAAEAHPGGMVSLMGMEEEAVVKLCEEARGDGVLVPANFNCPGQIVISGDRDACRRAQALVEGRRGVRAVPLTVAGAFHSPLMAPAAAQLQAALEETTVQEPRVKVVANVDACYHPSAGSIRQALAAQLTSSVRWTQSMQRLLADGVETVYEVGPGRVLSGLMRKIERRVTVVNISTADALKQAAA